MISTPTGEVLVTMGERRSRFLFVLKAPDRSERDVRR
jgi:hypothetical protein